MLIRELSRVQSPKAFDGLFIQQWDFLTISDKEGVAIPKHETLRFSGLDLHPCPGHQFIHPF